jgi:protein TonB
VARTRRIEGYVELEFMVGVDGRAQDIRVVAADPPGVFDTAATRALMRWRFEPGTRNGQPQPMRSRTRIGFRQG